MTDTYYIARDRRGTYKSNDKPVWSEKLDEWNLNTGTTIIISNTEYPFMKVGECWIGNKNTGDLRKLKYKEEYVENDIPISIGNKELLSKTIYIKHNRNQSLLELAQEVYANRGEQYGEPQPVFEMIAKLWSDYIGTTIKPTDVGMMMILLKVAREKHRPKRDNLADVAGYANVVDELKGGE